MIPTKPSHNFGSRRIYYNNFAGHLLNAYNPNMLHLGMPYRWSDQDWASLVDSIADFGFNVFEFWLEPRLFSRLGLEEPFGIEFARQLRVIARHAHRRGLLMEMICGLATAGGAWHTLCPNLPEEWQEIQFLWDAWTRKLPELDIVGIFPGDPGACSLNVCSALTYIDKSIEIAHLVLKNLPEAEIEFNTWGPPFFGWGNLQGPPGWKGEFIPEYQHTAWDFDKRRADESMVHLVKRLPDFPSKTSIGVNLGFDSDGNPGGERDARHWVLEIAKTHAVQTWDFSLTEGENNVVPHYRFNRLFARRKQERELGVYRGGICFTMTPLLNQLSLYEAAHSFIDPGADPDRLAGDFYEGLFGSEGRKVVPYLVYFEVIRDWGNYHQIELPRREYHQKMCELEAILEALSARENPPFHVHPSPETYRQELLFFARFFREVSGEAPDYAELRQSYWQRVYAIYDQLPQHVDPRPHAAVDRLIHFFQTLL
jgi:hypothetical protein